MPLSKDWIENSDNPGAKVLRGLSESWITKPSEFMEGVANRLDPHRASAMAKGQSTPHQREFREFSKSLEDKYNQDVQNAITDPIRKKEVEALENEIQNADGIWDTLTSTSKYLADMITHPSEITTQGVFRNLGIENLFTIPIGGAAANLASKPLLKVVLASSTGAVENTLAGSEYEKNVALGQGKSKEEAEKIAKQMRPLDIATGLLLGPFGHSINSRNIINKDALMKVMEIQQKTKQGHFSPDTVSLENSHEILHLEAQLRSEVLDMAIKKAKSFKEINRLKSIANNEDMQISLALNKAPVDPKVAGYKVATLLENAIKKGKDDALDIYTKLTRYGLKGDFRDYAVAAYVQKDIRVLTKFMNEGKIKGYEKITPQPKENAIPNNNADPLNQVAKAEIKTTSDTTKKTNTDDGFEALDKVISEENKALDELRIKEGEVQNEDNKPNFIMQDDGKLEYTDRVRFELGEYLKKHLDLNDNPITTSLTYLYKHHKDDKMYDRITDVPKLINDVLGSIPEIVQKRNDGTYYVAKSFKNANSNRKSEMGDVVISPNDTENYIPHANRKHYDKQMRDTMDDIEAGGRGVQSLQSRQAAETLENNPEPKSFSPAVDDIISDLNGKIKNLNGNFNKKAKKQTIKTFTTQNDNPKIVHRTGENYKIHGHNFILVDLGKKANPRYKFYEPTTGMGVQAGKTKQEAIKALQNLMGSIKKQGQSFQKLGIEKGLEDISDTIKALNDRHAKLSSHPKYAQFLEDRQNVDAGDTKYSKKQVSKGGLGRVGETEEVHVKPVYEDNHLADFELSKQDVSDLRKGNISEKLLDKLENDLGRLDNDPRYKDPEELEFQRYNEDNEAVYKDADGQEVDKNGHIMFAKGADNILAGAIAGFEEDEDGNITFNPYKAILAVGGLQVAKRALKSPHIKAEAKNLLGKAVAKVEREAENGNPYAQAFLGRSYIFTDPHTPKGEYMDGAFSDRATHQTMGEIDDRGAEFIDSPNKSFARVKEVLKHDKMFEKYPELKNVETSIYINKKNKPGGETHGNVIDGKRQSPYIVVSARNTNEAKSILLHELQHAIQQKQGWARGGSPDEFRKIGGNDGASPVQSYRNLHGEQMSRAVEYRSNMTPEQRKAESFQDTLKRVEGEYNEPIIKYRDGTSFSQILRDTYIKKDGTVNENLLKQHGEELPKPIESYNEFVKLFDGLPKENGKYIINTPVGTQVRIKPKHFYDHLTKNTNNAVRFDISGSAVETFKNPLFIAKQMYEVKSKPLRRGEKPKVIEKRPQHVYFQVFRVPQDRIKGGQQDAYFLAGFTDDKKGGLATTFFDLSDGKMNMNKVGNFLKKMDSELVWSKHHKIEQSSYLKTGPRREVLTDGILSNLGEKVKPKDPKRPNDILDTSKGNTNEVLKEKLKQGKGHTALYEMDDLHVKGGRVHLGVDIKNPKIKKYLNDKGWKYNIISQSYVKKDSPNVRMEADKALKAFRTDEANKVLNKMMEC